MSVVALLLPGVALAAVLAAAITSVTAGDVFETLGLPDPGTFTRLGLPVAKVIAEVGAVVCVGSLLFAAFLVPPQKSGTLSVDGYAALRTAGWSAFVWFLGSALLVPFIAADVAGRPVTEMLRPRVLVDLVDAVEQAKAWTITTVIALVVAIGCRLVLSWGWTAVLFGLSLGGLLPVVVSGHSASGGAHDLATNSLLYHLFGASLWIGGLVALVAHAARRGDHLALATRRFSLVALVCWIAMALSGVINALVRLPIGELLTSDYGRLVLAKIGALLALFWFGYTQRRRAVRAVVDRGSPTTLLQLGAVEVLVMLATVGLSVALGRTPPPGSLGFVPDRMERLIGYELHGPPTLTRLLFDWRFDLVYGTAALVLAGLYVAGVIRLRRRGDRWPVGRTIAWIAGTLSLLMATSSGIGRYSPGMFSVHMGGHMILSMLVPILLVLGAPVTLALRAIKPAGRDAPPGPREWLLAFVHSPISRVLTHPLVALVLFVGSFYGLYFSGLFDVALSEHWAHLAMNAHFLIAGYVFFWPVIGVDPSPRPLPPLARIGLMFAAMVFHAFFGIALMMSRSVIGEIFYRDLNLPWVTDLLGDQRLGGGLSWATGEFPVIVVVIALVVQWARADERAARRTDRRADADGDADLTAYNAMLAKLAETDRGPRA
ncbi:cytochrome c oxidase assembly protein [Streptoalloteichus tenebrarius]|uniref:cytochrome c oxidase assembly protein n=1 Tax=Streptoalloteichus tenebrarius (strain ATCC 17920 / DSM 40477 / JCM 4838 / CBS 697.72 / NBRC 16177 / NCIMB 11028 / NRRL B-12390 / A12253. 1 / ISP 5477) TaxID=1933 RepID=UPI0020A2777D|nr:cytochrome c oxidase assembly protein [Streptoalloteichus tenebrarius]